MVSRYEDLVSLCESERAHTVQKRRPPQGESACTSLLQWKREVRGWWAQPRAGTKRGPSAEWPGAAVSSLARTQLSTHCRRCAAATGGSSARGGSSYPVLVNAVRPLHLACKIEQPPAGPALRKAVVASRAGPRRAPKRHLRRVMIGIRALLTHRRQCAHLDGIRRCSCKCPQKIARVRQ
jgi:hypothetical protein